MNPLTVHSPATNITRDWLPYELLLNRQGGIVEAAAAQLLLWPPSSNQTGGFSAFGSLGTSLP